MPERETKSHAGNGFDGAHRNGADPQADVTSDPVTDTIDTIVELHMRAERSANLHQRAVERGTALVGRPSTLYAIIAFVLFWMLINALAPLAHLPRIDPPPFYWLQGACSLGGLLIALIVLITQNRQGRLNERRAQLDLQISMLIDQKSTKIIQLLEELRWDMPSVHNRKDAEAEMLTQTVDARAVIEALEVRMEADQMLAEEEAETGTAE